MCIVCNANNINRNVYMYLNTSIFHYWLRTSAVIRVYKARAIGGAVQDVYFSLHTVCIYARSREGTI